MEEGQIEIFGELVQEIPNSTIFVPTTTCAKCDHIIGVQFGNGNLFFCTRQKGGRYGKKIKKSASNCERFESASEETIPHGHGYYGGRMKSGLKR